MNNVDMVVTRDTLVIRVDLPKECSPSSSGESVIVPRLGVPTLPYQKTFKGPVAVARDPLCKTNSLRIQRMTKPAVRSGCLPRFSLRAACV